MRPERPGVKLGGGIMYELLMQKRGFLGVHLRGATLVPVSLVKQQWQQLAFFFSIVRLNRVKHNIRHHSVE